MLGRRWGLKDWVHGSIAARFLLTSDSASPEGKALVRALLDVVIATRQNRTCNGSTGPAGFSTRPLRRFPWSRRGD